MRGPASKARCLRLGYRDALEVQGDRPLDAGGTVVSEGKLRTSQAAFEKYFGSLGPARVWLEAATHSGWASRLIADYEHDVIVANPRELRKIYESDRKNDRNDRPDTRADGPI